MDSLQEQFEKASQDALTLPSRPANEQLLQLYALFKQATVGDVEGKRPGMLDLKGRAKFDAWKSLAGLEKEQAMRNYIALVQDLHG